MTIPVNKLQAHIGDRDYGAALDGIVGSLDPFADFRSQHRMVRLLRSLPATELRLRPLKLALLATSTVDHLSEVLRLYLAREGFAAEIFQSEYDTLYQAVLEPSSALYKFRPDVIWLFTNYRDVDLTVAPGAGEQAVAAAVDDAVNRIKTLWSAIRANCEAHIIQNNADMPLERTFGHFEAQVPWSRASLLRCFNVALAASHETGLSIFDLDHVAGMHGRQNWIDERYWFHSKHAFSLDAVGIVAHYGARLIAASRGLSRKCLVLDLDNTLWGGVIGDDGIEGVRLGQGEAEGEAFLSFQHYLKGLKERGIILAIASKNDEKIALEAISNHPEMVLRLDDFAVTVCNWSNKADNVRLVAETLDIGLDSLVFVDDSAAERALIRAELPMVAVPELPEDPALFVRALDQQAYFETHAFSDEDRTRAQMYRGNAQRKGTLQRFADIGAFLRDLDMEAELGRLDRLHLPRFCQLINKSNQFHPTTTRYTEAQVQAMTEAPDVETRWFKLRDRFGDNGLIASLIMRQEGDALNIDTWAMSCRVLGRGMEEFIHNHLLALARERGAKSIVGTYIPTNRNGLVRDLYAKLGYVRTGDEGGTTRWTVDVSTAEELTTFIKRSSRERSAE
jgi:FkbH-like protein